MYILDTNHLSAIWLQVFLPFNKLPFHFADDFLHCAELFSFMKSHLFISAFLSLPLVSYDAHMSFILHFVHMVYHIDWFANVEPLLHPWTRFHFIIVCDPFYVLICLLIICWRLLHLPGIVAWLFCLNKMHYDCAFMFTRLSIIS